MELRATEVSNGVRTMKSLKLFIASLAVTCFSLFPAFAQANELDELDVTMEVLDSIAELDGKVLGHGYALSDRVKAIPAAPTGGRSRERDIGSPARPAGVPTPGHGRLAGGRWSGAAPCEAICRLRFSNGYFAGIPA